MIGWKKAIKHIKTKHGKRRITVLIKLKIPKDAVVYTEKELKKYDPYNNNLKKCRTSKAKVLSIRECEAIVDFNEDDWYSPVMTSTKYKIRKKRYKSAISDYDNDFKYRVGKTVRSNLDPKDYGFCAEGIHFFRKRIDAIEYDWS